MQLANQFPFTDAEIRTFTDNLGSLWVRSTDLFAAEALGKNEELLAEIRVVCLEYGIVD